MTAREAVRCRRLDAAGLPVPIHSDGHGRLYLVGGLPVRVVDRLPEPSIRDRLAIGIREA